MIRITTEQDIERNGINFLVHDDNVTDSFFMPNGMVELNSPKEFIRKLVTRIDSALVALQEEELV